MIIMGRHADWIALAREFGATDVVSERGEEAVERVKELTGGHGAHSVLVRRNGRRDPHCGRDRASRRRRRARRGPALRGDPGCRAGVLRQHHRRRRPRPARAYLDELLPDVLEGRIEPGRVFDRVLALDEVPDGYRAMNEREALKVMVNPS